MKMIVKYIVNVYTKFLLKY